MKKYTTSGKSDRDITDIYKYSAVNFGFAKAGLYLEGMYQTFSRLGDNPGIGPSFSIGRKTYRRFEYESHVIFYKKRARDILIVRVLHERMDAKRHL
jgi:toxin ParE1/3/4